MNQEQSSRRYWRDATLCVLAVIFLLAAIAYSARTPLLVEYHQFKFEETRQSLAEMRASDSRSMPDFETEIDQLQDQLFHHESRLVELNAYQVLAMQLPDINWNTPASRALIARIDAGDCPPRLDWHILVDVSPLSINVWCEPNDVDAWKSFLLGENQRASD